MSYCELIDTVGLKGELTLNSIEDIKTTIASTKKVLPHLVGPGVEFDAVIVGSYFSAYNVIYGYIFGDKSDRWSDGHQIRTSQVKERTEIFENVFKVRTLNSNYLVLE
ncbi:hypothetical protein PS2_226 [Serratia phage PS2]|uniref:Uncharacterized protein n=1 Tax=Serratia phage PS2 TaxID=1481112 RepID=A0A023W5C0_9CAUD|nr:hypothetical protein FF83_gp189 [Serratia phage PS2]AHY25465.1 hypothetical protein PS2_226 [Serratia phage PS2]